MRKWQDLGPEEQAGHILYTGVSNLQLAGHILYTGVSNLQLAGHKQPRTAMNMARYKIVNLLKTL